MTRDPQVDLIFSHFIPRYEATGIDPNDLRALMPRITHWDDWCQIWSEEGARHEGLGRRVAEQGFQLTAAEAFVRAAMHYHYGKHLFAKRPKNSGRRTMRCCAATGLLHQTSTRRLNGSNFLFKAWRCRVGSESRAKSSARPSQSSFLVSTPARRSCMHGRRPLSTAAWLP